MLRTLDATKRTLSQKKRPRHPARQRPNRVPWGRSTVEIAACQIFKPTADAPRPQASYNLPIAVSSVIDLLTGLIRPRAFNFARE